MDLLQKSVLAISTVLGLLVFVFFFDAIFVSAAEKVSSTALLLLQLIPLVIMAVLVIVLTRPDKREQEVFQE